MKTFCGQCNNKHGPKECLAFSQQCSMSQNCTTLQKVCHNKHQITAKRKQTTNNCKEMSWCSCMIKKTCNISVVEDESEVFIIASSVLRVVMAFNNFNRKWLHLKLNIRAKASLLPLKVHKCLNNRPVA